MGLDADRIGLWACSGNVPTALFLLRQPAPTYLRCAVLYYGYMLDRLGAYQVAEAAQCVGFVNPCATKAIEDVSETVPLFLVRAGQDQPDLNETITHFLGEAVFPNLPLVFVNYAAGHHAFDLIDDNELSRTIILQTITFMQVHLLL